MLGHNLLINSGFQVDLYFFRIKTLLLRKFSMQKHQTTRDEIKNVQKKKQRELSPSLWCITKRGYRLQLSVFHIHSVISSISNSVVSQHPTSLFRCLMKKFNMF